MDTSLSSLRARMFDFRSWDSTGDTLNRRVREALNLALDRLAGDVPEALRPSEAHAVLLPDVKTETVEAYLKPVSTDKRIMQFINASGVGIGSDGSGVTWRPDVTGEWDGLIHIEIEVDGRLYRRQSLEFWTEMDGSNKLQYYVTIDRPWKDIRATPLSFRLHQPEFFFKDDVMQVLEPARIFDDTRQQVWSIDTAGAYRQDMVDFRGQEAGRPYRCWRGRHFQLPAPTEAPAVASFSRIRAEAFPSNEFFWGEERDVNNSKVLQAGSEWAICYTYVMGRRDKEWQQGPMIAPGGHEVVDSTQKVNWAFQTDATPPNAVAEDHLRYAGVNDPLWESAPSPVTLFKQESITSRTGATQFPAIILSATNIDSMLGFGDNGFSRFSRSGLRIRYYVSQRTKPSPGALGGQYRAVEANERFYFLCEVEPTYDQLTSLTSPPFGGELISTLPGARIIWTGKQLYDYNRPLNHSTGYFAWKAYPHQDQRYELDFRVLRLPRKFIDDRDTAPIQRDAVPCLLELGLHYMCLLDGADQVGAQQHMQRYTELVKTYRRRYANPGRIVEPVPLLGYSHRHRYGTFKSSE